MSSIIKASQIRQEEKLRQIFAEQFLKDAEPEAPKEEDMEALVEEQLREAKAQASAIIAEALSQRQAAEEYYAQVDTEMIHARELGYEEGFKQGVEEGFRAGSEHILSETQKVLMNLQREVEHTRMVLQNQIDSLSPRIIQLSMQIAEKIIRREVQLDPGIVVNQVETILRDLGRVKSLSVRVHPSEFERVRALEARFLELVQGVDCIEFVIDHSLEPGGCIIETNSGGVDASIKTQLELINTILLEGSKEQNA